MHEQSLLRALVRQIETVVRAEGAVAVKEVHVRLGALAHLSPEHLREHFEHAVAGGPAEGALLVVEPLDDPTDPRAQEVVLESVVVEDPE